jgi:hypothetical protein
MLLTSMYGFVLLLVGADGGRRCWCCLVAVVDVDVVVVVDGAGRARKTFSSVS